ncbi:MAG: HDIG domain-containing protein [Candidatus Omnitrophica bacterium]|nr:HDIG domain-containing protein [Candidatus Omnitrophota bacterium]
MKKILNKKHKFNKIPNKISHVLIALATCFILVGIIAEWDTGLTKTEFHEGDIVLRSIYAPFDFKIKGDIDYKTTEAVKRDAISLVPPVYSIDGSVKEDALNKINSFFSAIELLKNDEGAVEEKLLKIKAASESYNVPFPITSGILDLKDLQGFFAETVKIVEYIMDTGIISVSESTKLKKDLLKTVTLINKSKNTEQEKPAEEFWASSDIRKKIESFPSSLKDRKEKILLVDLISAALNSNVRYQEEETDFRKQAAAAKIKPVYNMVEVKKNELILNKGERVSKEHMAKLEAIEQRDPPTIKVAAFFGIALLVGLFILLLVLYIEFYEPDLIVGNKELVLLASICILMTLAGKLIVISPWPSNMIPVSAASMLIALLINNRLAIVVTCFLSIIIGMISGGSLDVAAVSIVGGIIGIFAVRNVRRRSQLISAGLVVGFANMAYFIGMGLLNSLDFNIYMTEAFIGLANGVMSAIIVTGVLPIFETTSKTITDISLLEIADLNHPILKEMVIKAPGTYHHSLVVGNLVEAACEAIGANALLARVSAYFHDIGKIEKAEYFSENQTGKSMHDKLSPTMSSLIITSHVKNGVELAQKYGLNRRIVDIIKQHHGTGLVFYFFKRALEKTGDEDVFEEGFRYPGPKPQTKEAACVLLADSVEAASRTLDDPTPSSIQGLVKKIINNKFIDAQLDECELTLKDLEKIAEIFTHILTGIYHSRVEYPEDTRKK